MRGVSLKFCPLVQGLDRDRAVLSIPSKCRPLPKSDREGGEPKLIILHSSFVKGKHLDQTMK